MTVFPSVKIGVKEAYNMYCHEGKSIGQIAREFTKKSYLTRTGKTFWERSVIWGMLKNPAYMGKAAFLKTKRVRRIKKTELAIESKHPLRSELSSPRDRPKEEWIYIDVPAIIDKKTFEYAQTVLSLIFSASPIYSPPSIPTIMLPPETPVD
jgi:site-specific DNA recombinase